jgi:hypothetical protein
VGCVNSLIEFRLPRNRQPTLKRPNKSERQSTGSNMIMGVTEEKGKIKKKDIRLV